MRRGDVFSIADGAADSTGKPRPALIIQDEAFDAMDSIIVIPITTAYAEAARLRVLLEPSSTLALRATSYVEIEKVTSMRRDRIGRFVGRAPLDAMRSSGPFSSSSGSPDPAYRNRPAP